MICQCDCEQEMSTDESTEIDVKKDAKTTINLKNLVLLDVQLLIRSWVFTEKIERTNVDLNYLLFNIDSDLICWLCASWIVNLRVNYWLLRFASVCCIFISEIFKIRIYQSMNLFSHTVDEWSRAKVSKF